MVDDYERSWHFPRTDLARNYLKTLELGAPTMALFAERRKGKTEFLNDDMTPMALAEGHRCCYINFWEDRSNPVACVVNGVEKSLKPELGTALRGWKKEVSVSLGALQAKITKDADRSVQTANAALQCLLEPKGTVLLQCDEIQHLAIRPEFEDFTASLRTFIDSNKSRVRTLFTGSSQDNLNRLFRHQRAAFYNSASIVPFPNMGFEFIEFLVHRFDFLSGRKLSADPLMSIFIEHHFSPAIIVELLQVMVRDGIYDLSAGMKHYQQLNPPDADNQLDWGTLTALDQALLIHLSQENPGPLYHKELYQTLSDKIGAKVTKSAIQVSLDRLREKGLLIKAGHGIWAFESAHFKRFVLEQSL